MEGSRPQVVRADSVLTNKEKYDVVVEVKSDSLVASVNGLDVSKFKTDYSNLTFGPIGEQVGDSLAINSADLTVYYAADVAPISE